jgi:hypothetical protein
MTAAAESLPDLCARLEREIEAAWKSTVSNGRLEIHAGELSRLFAIFRAYGGRADWRATDQNIAMLAPPVRSYIDALQGELVRLQKANLAYVAAPDPLPAEAAALIDPVASIIDYSSFVIAAGMDGRDSRAGRRRARDTARNILAMLARRKCLADFEAPAEARGSPRRTSAKRGAESAREARDG